MNLNQLESMYGHLIERLQQFPKDPELSSQVVQVIRAMLHLLKEQRESDCEQSEQTNETKAA